MGKYSSSSRGPSKPTGPQVHPLMRGIGCLSMVLIPVFSYAVADVILKGPGASWPLPKTWFGAPHLPKFLHSLSGLAPVVGFLQQQTNLTGNLIIGGLIMVVLFGIMSIIYGYLYSMMAPSKYGPHDVPPPRVKTKKYTR